MALIGKIRQNMWFVFALLGVALVAFMMMDSSPGGGGGASGSTAISVNGEKIDINKLQQIENIESNATGISGNALRSKVYDDLITKTIALSEGKSLGLGVSDEQLEDMLYGNRISPVIQQMPMFVDPRTRTINRQSLQDVKTNYENNTLNPGFLALWKEKIEQVKANAIQSQVGAMVSKGIYTPTWMADELAKTNSITADLEYVKVPFSSVADAQITDADYESYMNENKAQFNSKEEGRVVEYVTFDVIATKKDSIELKQRLTSKIDKFKTPPKGDSLYAVSNGGNFIDFYFALDKLPEPFQVFIEDLEVGDVYGPIINERYYSALKLIDSKVVADSVQLSHIFRPTTVGDATGIANAIDYIDSLKNLVESGVSSYDSLAIKYSQDPTSASKGGDLGYVTQGQFFPAINKIAFFGGEIGKLYRVKTENGVHLIKITDRIFETEELKYKVAFINEGIEPSSETLSNVTNQASEFINDNRNIEAMRAAVSKYPNATLKTSKVLKKKDYAFESFEYSDDSRDIVLWAFNEETELGDVSPDMYAFRDKTFNYESALVIPGLQAKTPKGMAKLADVKNSITEQVKEYARAKTIASSMKGKTMDQLINMEGATTGTVTGARTGSAFVGEIGYEPKIAAAIIATAEGQTTQPIVGTAGVYVVKISSKTAPISGNASFAKQSENIKARQNVNFGLFEGLRSSAEVKDKRMDYGM